MTRLVEEYLKKQAANGLSPKTILYQESILRKLESFKNPDHISKKDLMDYFEQIKKEFADSTFATNQIVIKKFFKDCKRAHMVDWIKIKKPKEKLKSDDILTTDDINAMLQATDSIYYKALIAFLFESGARFGELQLLKYKDFIETSDGMIVNIPTTKTAAGFRKVILPFSSQYIRNLRTYTAGSQEDKVFHIKHWQSDEKLQEIGKKAGITKPITPHKFRHAQATDLVKRGFNEAIIRKKLGWTPTSPMIARYQHLNDNAVIDATLQNTGKLPITAALTEIKEAEKITLVDAAMQFSKLTEENRELNDRIGITETYIDRLAENNLRLIEFIHKITGNDDFKKKIENIKEIQEALERCRKDASKTVQDAI